MFAPSPRSLKVTFALSAVVLFGAMLAGPAAADTEQTEFDNLCLRAQAQTANLHIRAFERAGGTLTNVDYLDLAGFAASKPQVRPLTTTRYTTYEDAANTLPEQVRCKGKSADHITSAYGHLIAGPEGRCAQVNERTVREVARSLTHEERKALIHQPHEVIIDPDTIAATGQEWLADFPAAIVDAAGALHLPSKSLYVSFDTPGIPEVFRGQHYCTLAADSYVKRLMLGRTQP